MADVPDGFVHEHSPRQIVDILRSAKTEPANPQLTKILECFKRRWLRWASHRYPGLANLHEDAVQEAQMRVLQCLDQLRDPDRVEPWADAVFRSVLWEFLKKHNRRRLWDREVKRDEDPDDVLTRLPSVGPGTEDEVSSKERRRIVREIVQLDIVAWLKFEEECTEEEIEAATGRSRNAIASHCTRIRLVLKRLLEDTDENGRPLPAAKIVEGTGLSRALREKIIAAIERLRPPPNGGDSPPDGGEY